MNKNTDEHEARIKALTESLEFALGRSPEIRAILESLKAQLGSANPQARKDLNHLIWDLTCFRNDSFPEICEPDEPAATTDPMDQLEADIAIRFHHPDIETGVVIIIQDCLCELDVAMAVSRICKNMPEAEYQKGDLFMTSLYRALVASDIPSGEIFLVAESHVIWDSVAHEIEVDLREDKSKAANKYGPVVRPWINVQTFEGLEIDCWVDEAIVLIEAISEDAKSTRH